MDHSTHTVACNRTCADYLNHVRHECCVLCHPPTRPSPPSTQGVCPECHLPADLSEELAKLSAAVAELQDLVVDLHVSLVGEDSEGAGL
jgi:hypothetical protein